MNSLKRLEYCSGFTVEISAPACKAETRDESQQPPCMQSSQPCTAGGGGRTAGSTAGRDPQQNLQVLGKANSCRGLERSLRKMVLAAAAFSCRLLSQSFGAALLWVRDAERERKLHVPLNWDFLELFWEVQRSLGTGLAAGRHHACLHPEHSCPTGLLLPHRELG